MIKRAGVTYRAVRKPRGTIYKMLLRDFEVPPVVSSPDVNLSTAFYGPLLSRSIKYERVAGYFESGGFAAASQGLADLVNSGGHIKLVVGQVVSDKDWEALAGGRKPSSSLLHLIEKRALSALNIETDCLELLSTLVYSGRLHARVAILRESAMGIFHPKLGVMTDRAGDAVSFTGSANETGAGWEKNAENLAVFRSWAEPAHHIALVRAFRSAWEGTADVRSVPLPAAVRLAIVESSPQGKQKALLALDITELLRAATQIAIANGKGLEELRRDPIFEGVRTTGQVPISHLLSEGPLVAGSFDELISAARGLLIRSC